jgi:hypothetical protein
MYQLQGQRFDRLLVVDLVPDHVSGKRTWLCKCDCGTWRLLPTERLTTGNTKSCGCLRTKLCSELGSVSNFKTEAGESGFRVLWRKYRWVSKKRNQKFELSESNFRELTKADCHYCGREPQQIARGQAKKAETVERTAYIYNGIDRKDPTIGYTPDNCVTACSDCNLAKQSLSYDQFLSLVNRIHTHKFKETA